MENHHPSPAEEYAALRREAERYYRQSAFEEAATLYAKAMNVEGASTTQQVAARYWRARCLSVLGEVEEAILLYTEIFTNYKDDPLNADFAFLSYNAFINEFLYLCGEDESPYTPETLLEMIEEGLEWLKDGDLPYLRPSMLLTKARILHHLDRKGDALMVAEDAYHASRQQGTGYYPAVHIRYIIRFARILGDFERAEDVLEDLDPAYNDPYTYACARLEHLRLVNAMSPVQVLRAYAVFQEILAHVPGEDHDGIAVEAYGEMGYTYLLSGSFGKAGEMFRTMKDQAWNTEGPSRRHILMAAKDSAARAHLTIGTPNEDEMELFDTLSDVFMSLLEELLYNAPDKKADTRCRSDAAERAGEWAPDW